MEKVNVPIRKCIVAGCGGALYDNRAEKAAGTKKKSFPDFKCKTDGDHAWYLDPKKGSTPPPECVLQEAPGQPPPPAEHGPTAKYTWAEFALTYQKCYTIATKVLPQGTMTGDVVAAAATLFIGATKAGLKAAAKGSAKPALVPSGPPPAEGPPAQATTPHRYFPPGPAAQAATMPKSQQLPADLPPEEEDDDLPF